MPTSKGKGGLPVNVPAHGNRGQSTTSRRGRQMAGRKGGKVGKGPGK